MKRQKKARPAPSEIRREMNSTKSCGCATEIAYSVATGFSSTLSRSEPEVAEIAVGAARPPASDERYCNRKPRALVLLIELSYSVGTSVSVSVDGSWPRSRQPAVALLPSWPSALHDGVRTPDSADRPAIGWSLDHDACAAQSIACANTKRSRSSRWSEIVLPSIRHSSHTHDTSQLDASSDTAHDSASCRREPPVGLELPRSRPSDTMRMPSAHGEAVALAGGGGGGGSAARRPRRRRSDGAAGGEANGAAVALAGGSGGGGDGGGGHAASGATHGATAEPRRRRRRRRVPGVDARCSSWERGRSTPRTSAL